MNQRQGCGCLMAHQDGTRIHFGKKVSQSVASISRIMHAATLENFKKEMVRRT